MEIGDREYIIHKLENTKKEELDEIKKRMKNAK